MRINNNLMAMNTHRMLGVNTAFAGKSMEKLSSGLRINRAGDDAAGLAISEKMRAQIRGLNQASRNAQDGISLIQTAEGASASIHDMLQRARELAVQAASATLTNDDRSKGQQEVGQIIKEIDRTANDTEFNTMKLLNKTGSGQSAFPGISQTTVDEVTNNLPGWINDSLTAIFNNLGIAPPDNPTKRPMAIEYYYDDLSTTAASMGTGNGGASLTLRVNMASITDNSGNLISEGSIDTLIAHEVVHAMQFTEMPKFLDGLDSDKEQWFMEGLAMAIQGGNLFGVSDHNVNLTNPFDGDYRSAYEAVKVLHEITNGGIGAIIDQLELGNTLEQAMNNTIQDDAGTELAGAAGFADFADVSSFISWFNTNAGSAVTNYIAGSADFSAGSGAITNGNVKGSNSNLTLDNTIVNGTGTALVDTHFTLDFTNAANSSSGDMVFQIGANSGQTINFQTKDLRANTIGVGNVDLSTIDGAKTAITKIDNAIKRVSEARSYFGSMQNRLEHTIKNLDTSSENLQSAESRIRDVDMAKEMALFTKNNILQQAAQAMLAQANQGPQGILQLLR